MTDNYYTAINALKSSQLAAMYAAASTGETAENEAVSYGGAGSAASGGGVFDFQALLLESFAKGGAAAAERTKTSNADFTRYGADGKTDDILNSKSLTDSMARAESRKSGILGRGARDSDSCYERESYDGAYSQNQIAERWEQAQEARRRNESAYSTYAQASGNDFRGDDSYGDAAAVGANGSRESGAIKNGSGAAQNGGSGAAGKGIERSAADSQAEIAKLLASAGLSGDGETLLAYLESLNGGTGTGANVVGAADGFVGTYADSVGANAVNGVSDGEVTGVNVALTAALKEFLGGQAAVGSDGSGGGTVGATEGAAPAALTDAASTDGGAAALLELRQKISEFLNSDIAVTAGQSDLKNMLAELMAIARNRSQGLAADGGQDTVAREAADGEALVLGTGDTDGVLSAKSAKAEENGDSRGVSASSLSSSATENSVYVSGAQAAAVTNSTGAGGGIKALQSGTNSAGYAAAAVGAGIGAGGKGDGLGGGTGSGMERDVGTGTAESKFMSALTDSADASKNQRQPGDTGGKSNGQTAYDTDFSGTASHQTRGSGNRTAASGSFGRGGESGAARGFETAIRPEFYSALSREAKLVLSGEKSEIVMNLTPETLGKMTMKVVTEQGVVSAKFVVENEAARQSLEENLTQLKDTLSAQGLNVESCMVEVRQDGGQAARYNESGGSKDASGQGDGGQNLASGIALDESNGIMDAGRRAFLRDRYFEQESSVRYTA